MKIGAICVTFNRPRMLGRAIHCFFQQTHPDCRLLVLDDGGQYDNCKWATARSYIGARGIVPGVAVRLMSVPERLPTLGDKRNESMRLMREWWPEVEAFAVVDDDDVYWPHHIASVDAALQRRPWAQPRLVYETVAPNTLKQCYTYPVAFPEGTTPGKHIAYGGTMAWRQDIIRAIGGYPSMDMGEDDWLREVFYYRHGPSADTISEEFPEPSYWYNREGGTHLTDLGDTFWSIRGQEAVEFVGQPQIGWNGPDYYAMPVLPGIHPRPWEDPALELSKTGLYYRKEPHNGRH